MAFQLCGIDPAPYEALFALDGHALRRLGAKRCTADSDFGYPCRASLEDASPGDELLLLSYEHQPADSPYRASGPIYVRRGSTRAILQPNAVPPYVSRRLMSLRAYDDGHMMIGAEVREGMDVAVELARLFADPAVAYVHLHNARRGCFSCAAHRA